MEAHKHNVLYQRKNYVKGSRNSHCRHKRLQKAQRIFYQNAVYKKARKNRINKPRNEKQKTKHAQKQKDCTKSSCSALDFEPDFRLFSAFLKVFSFFKGKNNARKRLIKLIWFYKPAPYSRVVYDRIFAAEALKDYKVIEIPKENGGAFYFAKGFRFHLKAFRFKPEFARSLKNVRGLRSVTRNATFATQHFKRNMSAVITQNHGKTGSTAFKGFHLKNSWSFYTNLLSGHFRLNL